MDLMNREKPLRPAHHPEETSLKPHLPPHLHHQKKQHQHKVHPRSTPLDFKLSNQLPQHMHMVRPLNVVEEEEEGLLLLHPLLLEEDVDSVGTLELRVRIVWHPVEE
jgi:hypothetical protein